MITECKQSQVSSPKGLHLAVNPWSKSWLRKAYASPFNPPLRETGRTALLDFTEKQRKAEQALESNGETDSNIPFKYDKELATTETKRKGFFSHFGASLFILYTIHPYTCDTNAKNLPQSVKAQHTDYSVDICTFNHCPAYMGQQ